MCRVRNLLTTMLVGVLIACAGGPAAAQSVDARDTLTSVAPEQNEPFDLPNGGSGCPSIKPRPPGEPDMNLCRGWPVDLGLDGAGFPYTPTLYDIDDDGADEIFLTGGHTFGLRGDGTFLPGWPTTEHLYMGYGTNGNKPGPSAADFDGDGQGEILWSQRDWWAGSSQMWSFNGRNLDGSNLPGFPQYAPDDYSNALDTPFVIADTDGDDDLEVWGPHTLGNTGVYYRVSAFDHTGTRLFTVDLNDQEDILSLYFGDLNGDGADEMFAVSWLEPSFWLHVFEADGSEVSGYPIVLHTLGYGSLMFGPPIPADLDGDGDLEILLGYWGGGPSYANCYHHDGAHCDGYPIQIATSSQLFYLGLGDITGDGQPELLATENHLTGDYRVFAIDLATGVTLPGWPYGLTSWPKGFPAVVDVDNDAVQDVCFATGSGQLFAVSGQGQLVDGCPLQMASPSISGVAAGDIDGDGLFELVAATWDGWVYAWETPSPALPTRADWPMRGVDVRNTGVFRPMRCAGDLDGDNDTDHSDLGALLSAWCSHEGDPKWNPDADLDGDGHVGHGDLGILLADWGCGT